MTRILQVCPTIGPGTGVGAVAHHLEAEWRALGHEVERFTLTDAHGDWLPEPGPGPRGKLALISRVVWFSTVGTILAARRRRRDRPDVTVCHNDAVVGEVYINHGIVLSAMRARGHAWARMARNPLHLFTYVRDSHRYGSPWSPHQLVVNLVQAEEAALRSAFPRVAMPTVVIGNGVDTARFTVPSESERIRARRDLGLPEHAVCWLFIGHEYGRKGLPAVLDALALAGTDHHLVVVGGSSDMVAELRTDVERRGLTARVRVVGAVPDPRPQLRAADVFVFPTQYESYGLVVLEALASGVPVVTTDTGCARDVLSDPMTGAVVDASPESLAAAASDVVAQPREQVAAACRTVAEANTWATVARRYLDAFADHGLLPRVPA